jgi:hypothetical protein
VIDLTGDDDDDRENDDGDFIKIGQFGWLVRDIYILQHSGTPGGSQITCCHGLLHSTIEGARKREPVPYPPTLERSPK